MNILAILPRTATIAQVLQCGAKTSKRKRSADLTQGVHGQHAQLAADENLTTLSIWTAFFLQNPLRKKTQFYIESPPFVISTFLNGRLKIFKNCRRILVWTFSII
jgi:hypothetical protein